MSTSRDSDPIDFKHTLLDGLRTLSTGEDWERYLKFTAQVGRYSFTNTMLIFTQRPTATLVMGKGERKNGKDVGWAAVGRQVKDGAQPIWIRKGYPKTVDDPKAADGKRTFMRFIAVPVFDVEDTYGDPLPEPAPSALLDGDDPDGLLDLVLAFIHGHGFSTEFTEEIGGGANGDMNPVSKLIRIAVSGRSPRQQLKTALHEAAHMLLHSGGKGVSVPREQKEVEAESVAYLVSARFGIDAGAFSFGYIAGWAAETGFQPHTIVKQSGKRIDDAVFAITRGLAPQAPQDEEREP